MITIYIAEDHSIRVINGVRETSEYYAYRDAHTRIQRRVLKRNPNAFDSWEKAHRRLIEKAEENVKQQRLSLERAKGQLGQIKGMKP